MVTQDCRNGTDLSSAEVMDMVRESIDGPPLWPQLPEAALYGIAGDIARHVAKRSEADPAAVLLTFLAWAGSSFGSGSYLMIGDTKHFPRLYVALVGKSSRARKGTSTEPVRTIFDRVGYENGACITSPGPLSSGEGLINAVRDPSEKKDKNGELNDDGVSDKRLLVLEGELGASLKASKREGNTLSATLRTLWDHGNAAPLTKRDFIKTSGAHVGVVGHITQQELQDLLQSSDVWNGFANRFLWGAVRRNKLVAFPQTMDDVFVGHTIGLLKPIISQARQGGVVRLGKKASEAWEQIYPRLTEDRPGRFGAVTSRSEAMVMRLALMFALLDGQRTIDTTHLTAAFAVWRFCDDSAKYIFGGREVNPNTDKVIAALASGPKTLTGLHQQFNGHLTKEELRQILVHLQDSGRINVQREGGGPGKGQPTTTFTLINGFIFPEVENLSEFEKESTG